MRILGSVNTNIFSSIGVVEARAQKNALWAVCGRAGRGCGSVGGSQLLRGYAVAFNKLVIAAHDDQAHVVDFRTLQETAVEQPVDLRAGNAAVPTQISDRSRDDVVAHCMFSAS